MLHTEMTKQAKLINAALRISCVLSFGRRTLVLCQAAALLAVVLAAARAGAAGCPIDHAAAQIDSVSGPTSGAVLTRDGRLLPITPLECIFYGDRVEARGDTRVRIITLHGPIDIGGNLAQIFEPGEQNAPTPSRIDALRASLSNLFNPATVAQIYARARGASTCRDLETDEAVAGAPLSPIAHLLPGPQRVGTDLPAISAAWLPDRQDRRVTLALLDNNGAIFASTEECLNATASIALPARLRVEGAHFQLVLTGSGGGKLRFDVTETSPAKLPRPPGDDVPDWMRGAWRLADAGPDVALDGLTRLDAATDTVFGAAWIRASLLQP